MTRQLLILVLLAGPLTSFAAAGDENGFWHPTFESASAEAQRTGRPVLIHFYADWCGPCRQMETRVLNQRSIQDGLRDRVVAVKVNYDRRADLVSRFGISALPCDVLIGADGNVLMKTTGFVGETTYLNRIERLAPASASPPSGVAVPSPFTRNFSGAQLQGAVKIVGLRLVALSE